MRSHFLRDKRTLSEKTRFTTAVALIATAYKRITSKNDDFALFVYKTTSQHFHSGDLQHYFAFYTKAQTITNAFAIKKALPLEMIIRVALPPSVLYASFGAVVRRYHRRNYQSLKAWS
jgi:glutaminase